MFTKESWRESDLKPRAGKILFKKLACRSDAVGEALAVGLVIRASTPAHDRQAHHMRSILPVLGGVSGRTWPALPLLAHRDWPGPQSANSRHQVAARRSTLVTLYGGAERGNGAMGPESEPPNKGMKQTKLSAAPTLAPQAALSWRCRLMPAKSATAAGTASQLIPRVGRTVAESKHG